jgi:hypothetical protein
MVFNKASTGAKIAVGFTVVAVVVVILAATGAFSQAFNWHSSGWIDYPYSNQLLVTDRADCEAKCTKEPDEKCVAYAYNDGAKRCFLYDKKQNTDTGIRTDINYGDNYPWGVGIRN